MYENKKDSTKYLEANELQKKLGQTLPYNFVSEPKVTKAKFHDYPNVHVACGLMPSEFSKDD